MPSELQPSSSWLTTQDLGEVPYTETLEYQRSLLAQVLESRENGPSKGFLLLLEHNPAVVTVTRRPDAASHVLASEELLAKHGIERVETDRGGDVTYHGPGQLVVYPIIDLNLLGLRIHGYVKLLEQVAIDTCAEFGVVAARDSSATGVWVGRTPEMKDGVGGRKIAALGVRVSRWISMHGLALNVTTNLDHYQLIVPCGLHGRGVTSLASERGAEAPTIAQVKATFEKCFRARVDDPDQFRDRARRERNP